MVNLEDDMEFDRLSKEAAEAYAAPVTPSWESFVDKLDAAMPEQNYKKKGLFWWSIPLLIAVLCTGAYFVWPNKSLTSSNQSASTSSTSIEKKAAVISRDKPSKASIFESKKAILENSSIAYNAKDAKEGNKSISVKNISSPKTENHLIVSNTVKGLREKTNATLTQAINARSKNELNKQDKNTVKSAETKSSGRKNDNTISVVPLSERSYNKTADNVRKNSTEGSFDSNKELASTKTEVANTKTSVDINAKKEVKDSSKEIKASTVTKIVLPKAKPQNFVQVGVGTVGVAAEFRHTFNSQFAVRVGGSYLATIKALDISNGFSINSKSRTDMNLNFSNAHIFIEYAPIKGSGLRVVTGVGEFINAKANLNSFFVDSLQLANTKRYTPQQIGSLQTTIDYRCIAPYLGIGLMKAVSKGRFSINIDAGTYYLNAPSVSIIGTKLLSKNARLAPVLQKQLVDYRWLPVFQLNLSYKL